MSFRERLESFRPSGASDSAFARFLGLPLMTLRGLLSGSQPSEKTILKLAKVLDKSEAEVRYGGRP